MPLISLMPSQRDAVYAWLTGGLGNQLFTYCAASQVAHANGAQLILDTRLTHHKESGDALITRFALPGRWVRSGHRTVAGQSVGRAAARIRIRIARARAGESGQSRYYFPQSLGYDPALATRRSPLMLAGAFQSWRYVKEANASGAMPQLALREPSSWLSKMSDLCRVERPLAVHVRRGDYTSDPRFDLLTEDYYRRAIRLARERGVSGPVWLFSDDPISARSVVPDHDLLVESSSTAAEDMMLMSHAAGLVISNSTFSWWAAWSAGNATFVAAPDPWMSSLPDLEDVVPPHWERIHQQLV